MWGVTFLVDSRYVNVVHGKALVSYVQEYLHNREEAKYKDATRQQVRVVTTRHRTGFTSLIQVLSLFQDNSFANMG